MSDTADTVEIDETHLECPISGTETQRVMFVPRERLLEVAEALRAEGYWMCVDLLGVDYLTHFDRAVPADVTPERFEMVASLINHTDRTRLRLRVQVPEDDCVVPSLMAVWPSVDFPEREMWDFFGIEPQGHLGVDRILMPDDWEGHPLRKDYAVGDIPVQFKEA